MEQSILIGLRDSFLERSSLADLPDRIWLDIGAHVTYGTNAIEGGTVTQEEVRKIIVDGVGVAGRPMSEILETVQHQQALRSLLARTGRQMDLVTILELHEAVFKGIKTDAGQWRRVNVRISGSSHSPPRMEKVIPAMERFLAEYGRRDLEGEDAFALGAWMHTCYERIHPFSDGNGRVGRLLLNLHLMKRNWLPVAIGPPVRATYIESLEKAPENANELLAGLIRLLEGEALLLTLDSIGTARDELGPLRVLDGEGGYSAKYLSLRAGQGMLPAVKRSGDWWTSRRAIELYRRSVTARAR